CRRQEPRPQRYAHGREALRPFGAELHCRRDPRGSTAVALRARQEDNGHGRSGAMRKRREVKVATKELVYDDNLNIVGEKIKFVPLDEARARGEAFRRKISELEGLGTDWLIRKYKKDGKVTFRAVLGVLAGIKRLYAGERDAS